MLHRASNQIPKQAGGHSFAERFTKTIDAANKPPQSGGFAPERLLLIAILQHACQYSHMPTKGQFKAGAKARSVAQRKYNGSDVQKKRRAERNAARRAAERIHGKKALAGKEVDHINSSKNGSLKNVATRILDKRKNRVLGAKKSHTGNSRK